MHKELCDVVNACDQRSRRQCPQYACPIAPGEKAPVQDGHDSTILVRAQQPPNSLLELQDHLRQHIASKPILTSSFHPRHASLVNGIIWWREGQPVDHYQGERLTRDVDTFPEGLYAKKDRIPLSSESPDEFRTRQVSRRSKG